MKKLQVILFLALTFTTFGCQAKGSKESPTKPSKDVLVFIDKSASVSYTSPDVQNKVKNVIQQAVNDVGGEGDEISVLYLHKNTRSASPEINYTVPAFRVQPGSSTIQVNKAKMVYFNGIKKRKAFIYDSTLNLFTIPNNSATKNGTDVIGTLEVISRMAHSQNVKTIYLFTDAMQASSAYQVNPKSKADAIKLADQHSKRIAKDYQIDKSVLNNAAVHFILPYSGLNTTHNPNLSYYWIELLKQFGVTADFN